MVIDYSPGKDPRPIKTPPDIHQGGLEFLKIVTDFSVVGFLSIDKRGDAHHKSKVRIYTEPLFMEREGWGCLSQRCRRSETLV